MGNVQKIPKYCLGCDGEIVLDEDAKKFEELNRANSQHLSEADLDCDAESLPAPSEAVRMCSTRSNRAANLTSDLDIDSDAQSAERAADVEAWINSQLPETASTRPAGLVEGSSSPGRICSTKGTDLASVHISCDLDADFQEADRAAEAAADLLTRTSTETTPERTYEARRPTKPLGQKAEGRDFKASTLESLDEPDEQLLLDQELCDTRSDSSSLDSFSLDLEGTLLALEQLESRRQSSYASDVTEWNGSMSGDPIDDSATREHRYGNHLFRNTYETCTPSSPNVVVAF